MTELDKKNNLIILNELSWILESIASTYTGEAKSSIIALERMLNKQYPNHVSYNHLHEKLKKVRILINELDNTGAAQILSPVIRKLWDKTLTE